MIMRHLGVRQAEMSERVIDRIEKAETPPTFGDSPTPLAPIGWCGEGVVVKSVSQLGVSASHDSCGHSPKVRIVPAKIAA